MDSGKDTSGFGVVRDRDEENQTSVRLDLARDQSVSQPNFRLAVHAGAKATDARTWLVRHLSSLSLARAITSERDYGTLSLFVPVCLGAGAVFWFSLGEEPSNVAVSCLVCVLAIAAWLLRNSADVPRWFVRAAFLGAAGMGLAAFESARLDTIILDSPVTTTLTGRVQAAEIDHKGDWRYRLAVLSTRYPTIRRPPDIVSVLATSSHETFAIGSVLTGKVRLSPPAGPAMPGVNDFAFAAYFDGIGAVGYFYGAPKPASLPDETGETGIVSRTIEHLRGVIGVRIRAALPGDVGAFATALITDERRAISPETTEALRLAGLAHIIAISGLNMALAAGIFFVGLRRLLSLSPALSHRFAVKKIAAFGALLATTAYYLLSGFGVSAERAYVMMVIMLLAVFFDRPSISIRNVALSATFILVTRPSSVMGPSFQMSFAATLALVAAYGSYQGRARPDELFAGPAMAALRVMLLFLAGLFITSLIGGLSTMTYSLAHFGRLTLFGLPANLASMPIISFIVMPAALMTVLLMPFGLDGPAIHVMGWGLEQVIAIAHWTAGFQAEIAIGRLPAWFLPVSTIGFVVAMVLRSWLRLAGFALFGLTCLGVWLAGPMSAPDLLIHEDGRLVGWVRGDVLTVNQERPAAFVANQWQRAIPASRIDRPIVSGIGGRRDKLRWSLTDDQRQFAAAVFKQLENRSANGRFVCEKGIGCVARDGPAIVIWVQEPGLVEAACIRASLVITPYAWRESACQSAAPIISRGILRRSGSLAIRFARDGPTARTSSIEPSRGTDIRAWTIHRLYDWRQGRFVVPASREWSLQW